MLKLTLFCGEINLKPQIEHVINVINLTHTKNVRLQNLKPWKRILISYPIWLIFGVQYKMAKNQTIAITTWLNGDLWPTCLSN